MLHFALRAKGELACMKRNDLRCSSRWSIIPFGIFICSLLGGEIPTLGSPYPGQNLSLFGNVNPCQPASARISPPWLTFLLKPRCCPVLEPCIWNFIGIWFLAFGISHVMRRKTVDRSGFSAFKSPLVCDSRAPVKVSQSQSHLKIIR